MNIMREKAQNKINNNIIILNNLKIINDSSDLWIKKQLITKYEILQNLNENLDNDIEKLCEIIRETQIEIDLLISKWGHNQ